jgi:uncharacterized peroxidase-related enzyme
MEQSPLTGLYFVTEDEVEGEMVDLYGEIKRRMQIPAVPHGLTLFGSSVPAMKYQVTIFKYLMQDMTLPLALQAMIGYVIAEHANCEYCTVTNELRCRTFGVDEDTLARLAADLGNVNPARLRAIIEFCLKAAERPLEIDRADYDGLREHGVSDGEILELIVLSAISVASDIIADAMKTPVDPAMLEALGR